jgi:hypothetical protein
LEAWRALALAQLADGQIDAYRETGRQLVRRFGRPTVASQVGLAFTGAPGNVLGGLTLPALSPWTFNEQERFQARTVRTCLLQPGTVADPSALLPLLGPNEQLLRGAVLCRAGRHGEALEVLAALKTYPAWTEDKAWAALYRALAEHARGHIAEARSAFQEAIQGMDAPSLVGRSGLSNIELRSWTTRVELQTLRREVADLVGEKPGQSGK